MFELTTRAHTDINTMLTRVSFGVSTRSELPVRIDRWAILVAIAVALIVLVGFATAWWIACQNKGLYPAFDMPSLQGGGTWKAYCRS